MSVLTYNPDGKLVQTGRNLRALTTNAKKRGVKRIEIVGTGSRECTATVHYWDSYYSVVEWEEASMCVTYMAKRWPGKVAP